MTNEHQQQIYRALSAIQLTLAQSRLSAFERKWLEVFHLKRTRMRDNGTVLKPENRARLECLTIMVEDLLDQHRQALN